MEFSVATVRKNFPGRKDRQESGEEMIHDEETDHLECNTNTAVGVLEYGKYFHLYNQGVQGCVLFRDHSEYEKFMKEYERNVDGVYRSRKP